MREILYRGKRKDNFEWFEGFYVKSGDKNYIIYDNDIAIGYVSMKEVIPETVGEYTGLTDKNGKKIFEGDILKCCDDKIETEFMAVVEFGNPNGTYSWGWQLKPISGDTFVNPDILLWIEMEETGAHAEIIGNIHDKEIQESEVQR